MAAGSGAFGPYNRNGKFMIKVRATAAGPDRYRSFGTFDEAEAYRVEQAKLIRPGKMILMRTAQKRTSPDLRTVYFVQSETGGPIKIGSAINADERIAELQQGHPERLVLLATARGGEKREREWHRRFAAARKRGEWFEPVPDLIILIAELRARSEEVEPSASASPACGSNHTRWSAPEPAA